MVPLHKVLGPCVRHPIYKTTSTTSSEILSRNPRLRAAAQLKTLPIRSDTYGEPWYSGKGSKGASLRVSLLGANRPRSLGLIGFSTASGRSMAVSQCRSYITQNHWVRLYPYCDVKTVKCCTTCYILFTTYITKLLNM